MSFMLESPDLAASLRRRSRIAISNASQFWVNSFLLSGRSWVGINEYSTLQGS